MHTHTNIVLALTSFEGVNLEHHKIKSSHISHDESVGSNVAENEKSFWKIEYVRSGPSGNYQMFSIKKYELNQMIMI